MAATLGLSLRLAWRELRAGVRGFRVFLACLAIGVGAIAAVGSISESVKAGLGSQARVMLGGDVDLRLSMRPAADAEILFLDRLQMPEGSWQEVWYGGGDVGEFVERNGQALRTDAAGILHVPRTTSGALVVPQTGTLVPYSLA